MSPPLLEARDLTCMQGDRLLFEDVSFALQPGALLQIEGPNGCGKTSLLRIVAGLARGDTGLVEWRGLAIDNHRPDYAADLLYIGHLSGVHPSLTPLEHLRMMAGLGGIRPSDATMREALTAFGLAEFADSLSRTLSEGQRRRAALARLLMNDAVLWILDEPLSALDERGRSTLEQTLVRHSRRGGITILSTHQPVDLNGIHDVTHLRFA